jgi:hypothetical protein
MLIRKKSIFPVITSGPLKTTTSTTTGAGTPSHNQKQHHMITATIARDTSYDLPEGGYRARISGLRPFFKQAGQGPQDWIRIFFEVHIPGLSENLDARAARNFKLDLSPGSELRNWLTGLLGKEYFKEHSGQQMSLDSLLNTECEVDLEHFYGEGYQKPHVAVARIRPVRSSPPAPDTVKGGKD